MELIRTSNINWTRLSVIITVAVIVWTGLATLIPPKIFAPVSVVLATVQSVITFLIRSGNYVEQRNDQPTQ